MKILQLIFSIILGIVLFVWISDFKSIIRYHQAKYLKKKIKKAKQEIEILSNKLGDSYDEI